MILLELRLSWKNTSKYFRLALDAVSSVQLPFLDICIVIDHEHNRYRTVPWSKPTASLRPLGCDSLHNPSIHASWVVARAMSFWLRGP